MKKFEAFSRHLDVLSKAGQEDLNNEFIVSGIIDKFNIQFELGWKVLKELLAYEGRDISASGSPRTIIKAAYAYFAFIDEEIWLRMLQERNNTAHIYNESLAKQLVQHILDEYIAEFCKMRKAIVELYGEEFLNN